MRDTVIDKFNFGRGLVEVRRPNLHLSYEEICEGQMPSTWNKQAAILRDRFVKPRKKHRRLVFRKPLGPVNLYYPEIWKYRPSQLVRTIDLMCFVGFIHDERNHEIIIPPDKVDFFYQKIEKIRFYRIPELIGEAIEFLKPWLFEVEP